MTTLANLPRVNLSPVPLAAPLDPVELVPDDTLRALARHDAARDCGEISEADQVLLAMVLPDLCGELLARRAVMRKGCAQ